MCSDVSTSDGPEEQVVSSSVSSSFFISAHCRHGIKHFPESTAQFAVRTKSFSSFPHFRIHLFPGFYPRPLVTIQPKRWTCTQLMNIIWKCCHKKGCNLKYLCRKNRLSFLTRHCHKHLFHLLLIHHNVQTFLDINI